jgi:hypothetical protein
MLPNEGSSMNAPHHRSSAGAQSQDEQSPASASASALPVAQDEREAPSVDAAYDMGAKGGPVNEAERLAFEAWMRGHCWALCAEWTGTQYLGSSEQGGDVDPRAMMTRRLWAAWRDRAALSAATPPAAVPQPYWLIAPNGEYYKNPKHPMNATVPQGQKSQDGHSTSRSGEPSTAQPPEGWALVPLELTIRMMAAAGPAIRACYGFDGKNGTVSDVWAALLSAAPQPAGTQSDTERDAARGTCIWSRNTDEDSGMYETTCGNAFGLNEGGLADNKVKFCCYCGKPAEEDLWSDDDGN